MGPAITGCLVGLIVFYGIILIFPEKMSGRQKIGALFLGVASGALVTILAIIVNHLEYFAKLVK
jgi:tetrahydromethanopterin S-methyltransferase subunit E